MVTVLKTYIMSPKTCNFDLHTASSMGAAYWFRFQLKVLLRDGWKPGVHLTPENTFKVLDLTQADRVHVHAEPGMQLYPFAGKFDG